MASSSSDPGRASAPAAGSEPELPWVREAIVAGLLGAATVAVVFFLVDVANGRPLWTPHALGAALFLGELAAPDATISPALIGGYTVIHGWVFVSVALVVAALMAGSESPPARRAGRIAGLAIALFVAFSAIFLIFGLLRGPDAARPFSIGWLMLVNALAAVVMAIWLGTRLSRGTG